MPKRGEQRAGLEHQHIHETRRQRVRRAKLHERVWIAQQSVHNVKGVQVARVPIDEHDSPWQAHNLAANLGDHNVLRDVGGFEKRHTVAGLDTTEAVGAYVHSDRNVNQRPHHGHLTAARTGGGLCTATVRVGAMDAALGGHWRRRVGGKRCRSARAQSRRLVDPRSIATILARTHRRRDRGGLGLRTH